MVGMGEHPNKRDSEWKNMSNKKLISFWIKSKQKKKGQE